MKGKVVIKISSFLLISLINGCHTFFYIWSLPAANQRNRKVDRDLNGRAVALTVSARAPVLGFRSPETDKDLAPRHLEFERK
jgi:hypothetical protein